MGGCFSKEGEVQFGDKTFCLSRLVAEGGYSFVYLATEKGGADAKRKFAVKKIIAQTQEQVEDVQHEIRVHHAVRHAGVMELLAHTSMSSASVPGATEFYLLFPFYRRGSLWDAIVETKMHMQRAASGGGGGGGAGAGAGGAAADAGRRPRPSRWPFSERECLRLLVHLCDAVSAMHSAGFAHRDIKPGNILLSNDTPPLPVLMDLGSAGALIRHVRTRRDALAVQDEASVKSTGPYRPPELYEVPSPCVLDGRCDMWSVGASLFAMAFGDSPFESPTEGVMTLAIISGNLRVPEDRRHAGEEFSEEFVRLLRAMINPDMRERITAAKARHAAQLMLDRRPADADRVLAPHQPTTTSSVPLSLPRADAAAAPAADATHERRASSASSLFGEFQTAAEDFGVGVGGEQEEEEDGAEGGAFALEADNPFLLPQSRGGGSDSR